MSRSIRFFIFVALFFHGQILSGSNSLAAVTPQPEVTENKPPMDIIITLDNSGSMKKSDPDFIARDVVARSLLELGDDSCFGLVVFDSKARLAIKLMPVSNMASRANILAGIDDVNYRGLFSDTPAAIETAIYELKNNGRKDAHKSIILMTDGFVDTGNERQDLERERWLKENLTEECRRSGIRIFGVAFSDIADFSLFQILAIKTDGEYFRTYENGDIQNIFDRIMEKVSVPADEQASLPPQTTEPEETTITTTKAVQEPRPAVSTVTPYAGETGLDTAPFKEKGQTKVILWVKILAGIFLLGVIFIIVIIYFRKSMDSIEKDKRLEAQSESFIPKAVLIDINNITGTKTFVLAKKINMIGRDTNNDVVIPQDTISSFHAVIEYREGFFYLEDQRSMNKTSLAGEELIPHSPRRLKSGDEILFNIYRFKFILPETIPSGKTMIDFHAPSETVVRQRRDSIIQELPALPKAIMVDVENITGKKTIHLKKIINKIGRGPENEIGISKDSISGFHATIEYRDGFFYLEDQRSKNKTSLGGEVLEPNVPRKLKSGDEILFDIYKFIFLLEYELPSGDTGEGTGGSKIPSEHR